MVCRYDLKRGYLLINNKLLVPSDHDINEIGICSKCSGPLKSLSSHFKEKTALNPEEHLIVSSCTVCSSVFVNVYDEDWSWKSDTEPQLSEFTEDELNQLRQLQQQQHVQSDLLSESSSTKNKLFKIPIYSDIINTPDELNQIPTEQLEAVFSKAEIQALFQKANHEKYVRQYYHRAKKKYKDFEKIFGIRINI